MSRHRREANSEPRPSQTENRANSRARWLRARLCWKTQLNRIARITLLVGASIDFARKFRSEELRNAEKMSCDSNHFPGVACARRNKTAVCAVILTLRARQYLHGASNTDELSLLCPRSSARINRLAARLPAPKPVEGSLRATLPGCRPVFGRAPSSVTVLNGSPTT